jgi:hypothetical protein
MTILKCEFDGHEWEREAQRGRPPRFCPDHRPIEDQKPKVEVRQTLPANTPRSIEELIPGISELIAQEEGQVELWCQFGEGHSYMAPRRKGRRANFCPTHFSAAHKSPQGSIPSARQGAQIKLILEEHPCRCEITPDITRDEIIKMEGCCMPTYACPTLDKVRRRVFGI